MGVLRALVGGAWVDVAGGSDEVFIGPNEPTDPGVELWVDSDAPTPAASVPNGMPRGLIGFVKSTTAETNAAGNTWLYSPILTVTFTADPARRYKVSWLAVLTKLTNVGDVASAVFNQVNGQVVSMINTGLAINAAVTHSGVTIETGLTGTQTRKVGIYASTVGVKLDVWAPYPGIIIVEDIGGT